SPLGVLSGTPTTSGTFPFTVTATDSAGCSGSAAYSIAVNCPAITVAPPTLPGAIAGAAYSQTLTASGGTGPYAFAVTSGALSPGLQSRTRGRLSRVQI